MRKWFLVIGVGVILCLGACRHESEEVQARVARLGGQIRCPVCRGASISDSPSALANQMMEIVRQQVAEGKSDAEILKYFEERYGEWALLTPKPEGWNLVIWVLPALFVLGGAVFIVARVKRRA